MADDKKDDAPKKKSPVKLIVLLAVGVIGGIAFAKFTGGGAASAGPTTTAKPEPGEVAKVDAININLADGHYLRIAYGVQLSKKVTVKADAWAKSDSSKVSDLIISEFSGMKMEELSTKEGREKAMHEVTDQATEKLDGEVIDIYLDEFVMQ
jgi:flagellar FliL protein